MQLFCRMNDIILLVYLFFSSLAIIFVAINLEWTWNLRSCSEKEKGEL